MSVETRPILAVTMGDPAGCGPEIVAQVAAAGVVDEFARIICVGDAATLARAFQIIGQSGRVRAIGEVGEARYEPGVLDVLDLHNVDLATLAWGKVQASAGQAAYEAVDRAIDLALAGQVDAVVTSALNKEALRLAGHDYDGHTEILAVKTGAKKVTMMLASEHFRVTHVSTHCSLRQAIERCQTPRILEVTRLTHQALSRMGIAAPKLAVAGLNPHSGEGGLFGTEEIEQIQPAIDQARAEGLNVHSHPVAPDTVFVRMAEKREFDAVIAQYHDQGHIPAKLVDFWGGVNITLGLPIIRTSVDHGTAFDIAGTGQASPKSLISALRFAQLMAAGRRPS